MQNEECRVGLKHTDADWWKSCGSMLMRSNRTDGRSELSGSQRGYDEKANA